MKLGRHAPGPARVDPGLRGVLIEQRLAGDPPAQSRWIDGIVQVSSEDAAALELRPVQRSLVVTLTSGYRCWSWNLAGTQVLFPDDEEELGGLVRGRFAFDLARHLDGIGPAPGSVVVSAGPHLSNVLSVAPPGAWASKPWPK